MYFYGTRTEMETLRVTFISRTSSTCAFFSPCFHVYLPVTFLPQFISSALPEDVTAAFVKARDDMLGPQPTRVPAPGKAYNSTFFEDTLHPDPVGDAGRVYTLGSTHQHQRGIVSPPAWTKHPRGDAQNAPQPDDLPKGHDVMKQFMEVRPIFHRPPIHFLIAVIRQAAMLQCPRSIPFRLHSSHSSRVTSLRSTFPALVPIGTVPFLPSRSMFQMPRRCPWALQGVVCPSLFETQLQVLTCA